MSAELTIRDLQPSESEPLGRLMVEVYSNLAGFPEPSEQPDYYRMLADIGRFTLKPSTRVLVAISAAQDLVGGVVYFGDMAHYGSGGTATTISNASGIRLLGVRETFRGSGAGKALTMACVRLAQEQRHSQVLLHTTQAMPAAWRLYEKLGFRRSEELDFLQSGLPVLGFRLDLGE